MGNTRGSEWRRWDLHIHTPESGMASEFSDWDGYVKALFNKALENRVAAIGITDYFTIDGYKKLKEEYLNNRSKMLELFQDETTIEQIKQIKLFPNIEFRLDIPVVKGKEVSRINYHVILSDEISIKNIEENFLHEIEFVYENFPYDKGNKRKLTKANIEELGDKIKEEQPTFKGNPFNVGCSVAVVNDEQITDILLSHKDIFEGKYVIVIPVDEDLSRIDWKSQGHMIRKPLYQEANMFFSSNPKTRDFGLGKKSDNIDAFLSEFKSLKPCIHGSDAHSEDKLFAPDNDNFCWIKADTTFEGLKQILYEPEERVRIQESDPTFDFDKSPFTEIEMLDAVKVFLKDEKGGAIKDEDNIVFAKNTIPLNSGLISIIGGRGTGKSKLIDYLSVGLGKQPVGIGKQKWVYSKSENIIVKRKITLQETDKEHHLSEDNSIPFMYISQSEIKGIVEDNSAFTNKIRTLIGIPTSYSISDEYKSEAKLCIDEYCTLIDTLYADQTSSVEKKDTLDFEIKKQKDFITNITSEENKTKLEEYKKSIETLQAYQNYQTSSEKLKTQIETTQEDLNNTIKLLNDDLKTQIEGLSIPLIDLQGIINYINDTVLTSLKTKILEQQKSIDDTKNNFSNFTGDLSTLLDNVKTYQETLNGLNTKKIKLESDELKLKDIVEKKLTELSTKIEQDIINYKNDIENNWSVFTSGKEGYTDQQKQLLNKVLGNDNEKETIKLRVTIEFDEDKFYDEILEPMDKRSWKKEYLKGKLQIDSFESYISFIKKTFDVNIFDRCVNETKHLLKVMYLKYTDYISHRIEILVNNKTLKHLSVGQRGTVYLRLQLASNLFSETIIYDQPEDDLDNDFITNSLVDLFKEIKKFRQVIIVSHNANLVVNADSEQVIVASNNDGILSYKSGALEAPEINKEICRILEGGKDAFEKREKKYGFRK